MKCLVSSTAVLYYEATEDTRPPGRAMTQTENPFARKPAAVNPFAPSAASRRTVKIAEAADPSPAEPVDTDARLAELLDRAAELRDHKAAVVAGIDAERAEVSRAIFDLTGRAPGKHTDARGRSFSFRRPSPRRSTDYKVLESLYPDAYAAAVKVTEPDEDALPSLYLGKWFAK